MEELKTTYNAQGWTLVNNDLNAGCGSSSDFIYLLYKSEENTDGFNHGYITDFYISNTKEYNDEVTYQDRTYKLVPYKGSEHFVGIKGDLNSHAGGDYIHLYYTTEPMSDQAVSSITFNGTQSGAVGNKGGSDGFDLNNGCENATKKVYMHFSTNNAKTVNYISYTYDTTNVFCGINKTADGSRTAEKGDAHRDVIMARTGETYLVKAEAQVRLGKYQDAINTVNVLRARGQWKKDENRGYYTDGSMAFLKADGGINDNSTAASTSVKKNKDKSGKVLNNSEAYYATMTHTNTYYLSTGIEETTAASDLQIKSYTQLPAEDEAVLNAIGASGDYDRMLNFIFNERTRELLGEWNRWDELARTGLLVKRAKAFNPEAAPNVQDRHMYRPIPQKFIDALQNEDGSNLSDAEKKAWQNPGY